MNGSQPLFLPAVDREEVQAVVVHAAVAGDADCLARLPALLATLDEPYRTVADQTVRLRRQYTHVDANVLGSALAGRRLSRLNANGQMEELQAGQVVGLILNSAVQPGQARAYLDLLGDDLARKRRAELKSRVQEICSRQADEPQRLLEELQITMSAVRSAGQEVADRHPTELLEIIPYAQRLEQEQVGADFQGLNSGFQHVNSLCNGLDTGLSILAARPGEGKTTLVWQMCCQAAELNQAPVIFVSLEQSKKELRAKALARLARLEYRHVLRGRLSSTDAEQWPRLLGALHDYGQAARRLTIVEGDEFTTVDAIRQVAEDRMTRLGAARCLIAVDYLQIVPLANGDASRVASAKDKVDLHVSAFRRLARDLNACVLCISSENRAGYKGKDLAVFKESGGIEYSADVAAVLTRDTAALTETDYRRQLLNVVKNRNGERGVVQFKFYARRAEFVETGSAALPDDEDGG